MVFMMNTTTLFVACLVSFTLIGVAYAAPGRAASPQDASGPTQPASARCDDVPSPEATLVASEVVIVGKAPVKVTKPVTKSYTCGVWEDSQVGGRFKRCEWK